MDLKNYTARVRADLHKALRVFHQPSVMKTASRFDTALARTKDVSAIVQAGATVIALVFGATWFAEQRQRYPRLKIEQYISHYTLQEKTLLIVDVQLTNVGNVVIRLQSGEMRVSQITPLTDSIKHRIAGGQFVAPSEHEARWDDVVPSRLTEPRLLEANETDWTHDEFLLECNVETVSVYTFYKNPYLVVKGPENEVGWSQTKLYNLGRRNDCSTPQSGPVPQLPQRPTKSTNK